MLSNARQRLQYSSEQGTTPGLNCILVLLIDWTECHPVVGDVEVHTFGRQDCNTRQQHARWVHAA